MDELFNTHRGFMMTSTHEHGCVLGSHVGVCACSCGAIRAKVGVGRWYRPPRGTGTTSPDHIAEATFDALTTTAIEAFRRQDGCAILALTDLRGGIRVAVAAVLDALTHEELDVIRAWRDPTPSPYQEKRS